MPYILGPRIVSSEVHGGRSVTDIQKEHDGISRTQRRARLKLLTSFVAASNF